MKKILRKETVEIAKAILKEANVKLNGIFFGGIILPQEGGDISECNVLMYHPTEWEGVEKVLNRYSQSPKMDERIASMAIKLSIYKPLPFSDYCISMQSASDN